MKRANTVFAMCLGSFFAGAIFSAVAAGIEAYGRLEAQMGFFGSLFNAAVTPSYFTGWIAGPAIRDSLIAAFVLAGGYALARAIATGPTPSALESKQQEQQPEHP